MSLYTALSPRSWILSSLRVSLALQKCQTRWQYVKYGKIADLRSINFVVVGIRFLNLIITPTLWLALLHTSLMCSLKFNLLSIVTPKIFNESDDLIILPFRFKLVLCSVRLNCSYLWPYLFWMNIVWYFFKLPSKRLFSYQSVALLALSSNLVWTVLIPFPVWYIWWSSAYIEMLASML